MIDLQSSGGRMPALERRHGGHVAQGFSARAALPAEGPRSWERVGLF